MLQQHTGVALPRDVQDRSLVARIFWLRSKRLELANYPVFRSGETEREEDSK
jgi:hypothetical protein